MRPADETSAVATERVPDVKDSSRRAVEDGDVSLIGRRITDVAAGYDEEPPAHEAEGRSNLLAVGQECDRRSPHHVTVGHRELLHVAVGDAA